jgi:hypothetical protein
MQEIDIKKDDVLEQMYFVLSLVQNASGPIRSRIGGKNDYMGGIIDRYVNTVVESLVFSKILFPKLKTDKKVELIRDFYSYEPSIATIAPDLFGIIVNNKAIPFVMYDNGWKPLKDCPQVEIKTLKRNQRMLSLVNQHYDYKYLIITESDYNTDYLMPFLSTNLFNDLLYNKIINELNVYNKEIIVSDVNGYITPIKKVDFSNDSLGRLKLMLVTKTKSFIEACNVAGKGITPECIETKELTKEQKETPVTMTKYCDKLENNYYRFNDNWYSLKNKNGKKYRSKDLKVTLDFYCSDISLISFLKMNIENFYIRVNKMVVLNNETLEPGDYKIKLFSGFDRSGTTNEEYFIDKAIYQRITNCEKTLLDDIQNIIDKNS